jgi:hypothetical protein
MTLSTTTANLFLDAVLRLFMPRMREVAAILPRVDSGLHAINMRLVQSQLALPEGFRPSAVDFLEACTYD